MSQTQANAYLRNKVFTANPAELRLMLFDGAIKFCRQAEDAIARSHWEGMYTALVRAQSILMELNTSLKHEESPELCSRLGALYIYMYRRLVDANLEREIEPVREVLRLLDYERQTWLMLMSRLTGGEEAPDAKAWAGSPTGPIGRIGPEGAGAGGSAAPGRLSVEG